MTDYKPVSLHAQLMQLLAAVSPDLPALVAARGTTVAVNEAARRLATARQETRKHLAGVEAQRDESRRERDAAIDLAAGLIGYADEYHVAKWGYDKELQRLQDVAKGAP